MAGPARETEGGVSQSERLSRTASVHSCPTCGQTVPASELLVDARHSRVTRGGTTIRLTPIAAVMLAVLVRRAPQLATHDDIIMAVWSEGNEPEDPGNTVKVHISQMRIKLAQIGVSIVNSFGRGYSLHVGDASLTLAKRATARRRAA